MISSAKTVDFVPERNEYTMAIEYIGLKNIEGPLAVIEGMQDASYEEMVSISLDDGTKRNRTLDCGFRG